MACEIRFHAFERCLPSRGIEPLARTAVRAPRTGERRLAGTPFDHAPCTIS
ncbi:hypothetical protein ABDK56_03475 [Sphingomonas sp. ASV193]|uniref:hypothetical protein n=1 Tax=Sphingomonas sp. ASV193 TaxID=3144405 RepID=UPI0032E89C30